MNDVSAAPVAGLVRPRPQRIVPSNLMTRDLDGDERAAGPTQTGGRQWEASSSHTVDPQQQQQTHANVIPMCESPEPVAQHLQDLQDSVMVEPYLPKPAPQLVRPVALKVSRPIPQSAVEQFYNETYQHGMKAGDVHAATVLAQDWHRKWTQQDEEGHTMPEPEGDSDPYAILREVREARYVAQQILTPLSSEREEESNFAYNPLDRGSGAKNPSPEELQEDLYYERKRLRLSISSESVSSVSPNSGESRSRQEEFAPTNETIVNQKDNVEPPSSKRRVLGFDNNNAVVIPEPEKPVIGGLLRPVALRVQKPQAIDVSTAIDILTSRQNYINDQVPADIIKELRSQHSTLSPLTLPSVSSSYKKLKPAVVEDDEEDAESSEKMRVPSVISHVSKTKSPRRSPEIEAARMGVLHRLAATGGDVVEDTEFLGHLDLLKSFYAGTSADTRFSSDPSSASEGMWLTLTKPTFFGNLGTNDDGDPMYTLGRMSFDMFSPTRLVCSLQGNFNSVEQVADGDRSAMLDTVPKALHEEVEAGNTILRTYNIITAFTIEPHLAAWPNAPNKDVRRPIRGIMTTEGYTLPDPENPNRHSVWITGGRIEPNNDPIDQREWKRQFAKNPPKHGLGEKAKLLAVKLLMGATIPTHMEDDGALEYTFQRPLGGHGLAYVDTLYQDESIRIVQGHRGTIFVFSKLPPNKLNKT